MGTTKTHIFDDRQNELADIFRVLANPARVAILEFISQQKACICNDIVEEIGLAQPTISQHLKELKRIGLLSGEIEGKKVCYCIDGERWMEIREKLDEFFEQTTERCC